jgi:hypothetical protein
MVNLILNPSFTQGATNWTFTDCTTASTNTQFLFNNIAREITASSGTTAPVITSAIVGISAATTYTASIYVKLSADQANTSFSFSLKTYQSDGTTLVNTFTSDTKELQVSTGWYRFTVTGTSGALAVKAKISLTTTSIVNRRKFVIDGAQLVTGYSATQFDYIETVDQGQENKILNKALSPVPFPHLSGAELNADIKLGEFVFNTIDANNVAYIITGISGLYGEPEPEYQNVSRGFYADGDYDVRGRYQARQITITGSILVQDRTYVQSARDKLIRATDLVKRGAWLKVYPNGETPKAIFVRLSGSIEIDVVNPRGRMDFSLGLRAADPLMYEWNEDREDGYFVSNVVASNYEGTQTGEVTITNNGNYRTSPIYEVKGPITGTQATIFNYSNQELLRIVEPVRGERYYSITRKQMNNYVATLKFATPHDIVPGDSITVNIPTSTAIANVQFTASTDVVLFTVASTAGYSVGDSITISSLPATNTINSYNGTWTIVTVPTATTFTITDTAGATDIADTTTSGNGTAYNITNSRFDGEQVVSGVPDAKSIYFSTLYREKYALRNVSGSNVQSFTCVVFKDADYLEIDTKDQEVSLNGNSGLYRGYIDTLSDWVRLDSNNNKILLDDAQQVPLYVEKRTRVAATGSSTLSFPEPHTYSIGDNILVRDVGSTYDTTGRAVITSYSRAGNVVTAIATAHGFSTSDVAVVGGVDYAIDGRYSVTNINANAFSFVTNSSGTVYSTEVEATAKKTIAVATFGRSSNTVTLTTSTAHGLTAGSAIYVAGVHPEFDGQWYVATAADTTTLTYSTEIKYNENYPTTSAPTGANVYRRFPVLSFTDYSVTYNSGNTTGSNETNVEFGLLASVDNQRFTSISKVARQSNIATVTTTTRHGYEVGEPLTINGNTESSFYVGTGNEVKISTWSLSTNTVTVVTSASHGLLTNDKATIYGVRTGAFFDLNGQYSVTNVNATAFTYTISGPITLSYIANSYSVVDNIVRLQLTAKPEFDLNYDSLNNDYPISTQINVQGTGFPTALTGVHDIVGSDTETNVVWFTTTAGNVAPTAITAAGNTVNVVYTVTPERGRVQRVVEAVYYTINNSTGATEDLGPLMTNPAAGTRGWVRTNTAHGFIAGDTVLISGLSPLFDGTQKIAGIVGTTVFYFTVDVTTLVAHQSSTLTKAGTAVTLTFTSAHGFVPGDKIWIYAPNTTYISTGSGVQTVLTTPSTTTLKFTVSTSQTQATAQAGYKVLPYQEDADATIVYPVLDDPAPTDFTFSYKNANVTNVSGNTIADANTAGEVVFSSDARMNVFYRSAWIG